MTDRFLDRSAHWTTAGIVLLGPVPALLGIVSASYVMTGTAACVVAAAIVLAEPPGLRRIAWSAFALAFFCRFLALIVLGVVQLRSEGAFVLGPDGIVFFRNSLTLAHAWSRPNPAAWGTYDVGQYYLFSSLIRAFGADLFAIQLFNCGLSALNAMLMLSITRSIRPAYASMVAVLVAVYPSSITIVTFDLWKDPSVSFAMVLCVWGGVRLCHARSGWSRFAFAAASTVGLVYLRCTRFYVAAYLELAVITLIVVVLFRRVPTATARFAIAGLIGVVVLVAEGGTWYLGWPVSPRLLATQIEYALHSRTMLDRTPRASGLTTAGEAGVRPVSPARNTMNVVYMPSPDDSLPELDLGTGFVGHVAGAFRRLFGPYIWVWPSRWSIRLLFQSDYFLYPGMVIWYSVMPFIAVGLIAAIAAVIGGREADLALCGLAVFVACYFAQYLVMNLSYRQRDMMFPILAVFAVLGAARSLDFRAWRSAYAAYWAILAIVAVAHLAARARLSLG